MANKNNSVGIIIYEGADGAPSIDVRVENETVWLTQAQLAELFNTSRPNITMHIKNIFDEGELSEVSVCKDFLHTATDGKKYNTKSYNLDLIISLGYRIKSDIATRFRQWATERLREYLIKGFTMNDEFLKENGGGKYWYELLDRIRDIRSSEKVLYRQVLDLYATSIDYNPKALESIKFFKIVQNKLHYAAHGNTAAEVIVARANAGKPFMGLLSFSDGGVSKKDIAIAKNYLDEKELKVLNNIVSAFFDLAEVRAMEHEPMYMKDWIAQLDKLIGVFDKKVLTEAGSVSHSEALKKAEVEYKKFQAKTLSPVEKAYLENIKLLEKKVEKKIKDKN
ncbi:MAG: cell filamentation protein Fic [Candidatus Magasanikbacteria bacterium RIFCSPHIGHO2_01_FULL_41_23]|uniref:Cell filamentation protein Fic n=1 Tax=Candidatus Magasanikbacteria bacterium RIFCSPLOWO2_01_FULL_40_15 TaxID=1798686 RepID=A0A1F6N0E7_9BACT|nr:MAG: cell filamentation protein Fic [Candidatus Magasanikbacteria bacterium RIFCSPHIGHO2_01_FULL_41_23]OGH74638.1 MAG: cell filamentation protein Fic [Candidatus Magasanikbacteria bacterium RIFCSPHIGHO2_12_FULL_41_16]OGH77351.1 MAG: cell filamentation protein Fic [Candidatus Magasanikbacteria bacterium RIFCSPLOWO2_01_FULL_40_15]